MINLITGTPGSGKTAYAIQFLLSQLKGSNRKIYVHGIPDLKIPHEKVYCRSKTCDTCFDFVTDDMHPSLFADNWHIYAPEGAVYFFDECQNIYRPRSSSAKVPESVASFEVHRHRGLDFFLISQNPKLIDVNIRALISRHIHLKPTWAGRFQYEWAECKDSIQSVSDAIKTKYKLDKKTFALYKSASVHTKQERKVPPILYILIFFIIGFVFLSTRVYSRVNSRSEPVSDFIEFDEKIEKSAGGAKAPAVDTPADSFIYYDYKELSFFSYSSVPDPFKLPPETCHIVNQSTYKCFIPKHLLTRFRNSFCMVGACYAVLKITSDEFI